MIRHWPASDNAVIYLEYKSRTYLKQQKSLIKCFCHGPCFYLLLTNRFGNICERTAKCVLNFFPHLNKHNWLFSIGRRTCKYWTVFELSP